MPMTREIRVLRGSNELDCGPAELFRMPDGKQGAKWRGLVFPVRPEGTIEIGDAGLPPAECQPLQDEAPAWRFVAGPEGAGSYVFVDGDAHACRQAERQLREGGFDVARSGPNLSGGPGDWFIRLEAMPEDATAKLRALLAGLAVPPEPGDELPLRERLLAEALSASRAALARLRSELEQARASAAANAAPGHDAQGLVAAMNAMASRLAEAEAQSAELRACLDSTARPAPPSKAGRLEAELGVALAHLLPGFEFLGASMRFIAVELPDRAILWKALAELDRQQSRLPPRWKSLSGHPGWWERHFSTGQDDQGRIYARWDGKASKWQILVSHKQEQALDLKRIARL